jgi:FXSXX-COOH protein
MGDDPPKLESDLVDVGGLDLDLLVTMQDTVLAQAIRRVLRAAECPDEATLGFQQSI